jgi:hypothetical protein
MSANQNKSRRRDLARMRSTASAKYFAKKTVTISGDELDGKDLAKVYDAQLAAEDAVDVARSAFHDAIAARDAMGRKAQRISKALEGIVGAAFGTTSKAFAEFGFTSRRVTQKSAATKARAVEKQRATRKARNTMGVRQKARAPGDTPPSNGTTPKA